MLMQCAITSGLRRPRNLSPSRRPPGPPAFCRKGGSSRHGAAGAEERRRESSGLPREGRGLRSPLPGRVGRERGRAGQREGESPSLGAARGAHSVIKEEVVLSPLPPRPRARARARTRTQTHLHSIPQALLSSSLFDTKYLLNNSAAAIH